MYDILLNRQVVGESMITNCEYMMQVMQRLSTFFWFCMIRLNNIHKQEGEPSYSPSHLSSFMETVYGYEYTHASICLDAMNEKMYSFNYKGFCMETVSKYKRHGVEKSISFQLQVTDAAFERLQNKIEQFVENREDFCYSSIGVVFCFVHIPFKRKKHYFCSQFVAEILAESGALKLKRRPSLYLPNHFYRELKEAAELQEIQYDILPEAV